MKTDEELAAATILDNKNFDPLIDRYTQKIRRYIAHLIGNWQESEDVAQDVFFLAYKNIASFNRHMKFSAWLYRIAHNQSVNYIRKHYNHAKTVEFNEAIQNELAEHINFGEIIDKHLKNKDLKLALTNLSQKDQEMIYLAYHDEKKYDEIADILEMPVNSVGPTLNRVKKKLKVSLEKRWQN
jgi:RNA polymerase sigma-70 factor (ECF subfamily)